jgi:hypothetical protein
LGTHGRVIGAGKDAHVRDAARAAVEAAARQLSAMQPATDFSLPPVDHTRTFVLTSQGAYASAPILEEDFGEQRHGVSPLVFAVLDVISAIRQAGFLK